MLYWVVREDQVASARGFLSATVVNLENPICSNNKYDAVKDLKNVKVRWPSLWIEEIGAWKKTAMLNAWFGGMWEKLGGHWHGYEREERAKWRRRSRWKVVGEVLLQDNLRYGKEIIDIWHTGAKWEKLRSWQGTEELDAERWSEVQYRRGFFLLKVTRTNSGLLSRRSMRQDGQSRLSYIECNIQLACVK